MKKRKELEGTSGGRRDGVGSDVLLGPFCGTLTRKMEGKKLLEEM
jgi:hypothetical protein